jgi:hypothetical protein
MDFQPEDLLGGFDVGDIFSDTGSDQTVLEPARGSFDLASGLRREGVNDLHMAVFQHLFPLRGGFIGQKVVFSPEGVPSLNKSKDTVGVYIIGVRKSISEYDVLESNNMGPAGFFSDQSGIEDETAIIV